MGSCLVSPNTRSIVDGRSLVLGFRTIGFEDADREIAGKFDIMRFWTLFRLSKLQSFAPDKVEDSASNFGEIVTESVDCASM